MVQARPPSGDDRRDDPVHLLVLSVLERDHRRGDPQAALPHQPDGRRRVQGGGAEPHDGKPAELQIPDPRLPHDRHALAAVPARDPLEEPDLLLAVRHVGLAQRRGRAWAAALSEGVSGRLLLARPRGLRPEGGGVGGGYPRDAGLLRGAGHDVPLSDHALEAGRVSRGAAPRPELPGQALRPAEQGRRVPADPGPARHPLCRRGDIDRGSP